MTKPIAVDPYVLDVLMRDLVGHDHSPSSFIVYLHLYANARGRSTSPVLASHQQIAESVGLSKSAVQTAIRNLLRRRLLQVSRQSPTAIPEYRVLRPWRSR